MGVIIGFRRSRLHSEEADDIRNPSTGTEEKFQRTTFVLRALRLSFVLRALRLTRSAKAAQQSGYSVMTINRNTKKDCSRQDAQFHCLSKLMKESV